MARSYRRTKLFGNICARSEKWDKRQANRKLRHLVRLHFKAAEIPEVLPIMREVANIWSFAKDGKSYWDWATPRDMRK